MRIASINWRAASMQPLGRAQVRLADAQTELTTGRLADPGRTLGARSARHAALDGAMAEARATREALGVDAGRMTATQTALDGVRGVADALVASLVTARSAPTDERTLRLAAEEAGALRATLVGHANARLGATHLLGGTRTDAPPLADPATSTAAATHVRDAFTARFGHSPDDAASAAIDAAAMDAFLADLEADFAATDYAALWAGDPPATRTVRLGPGEAVDVPATHHDPAIRDLVLATSIAATLADAPLSGDARNATLDRALGMAGAAQGMAAEAAGRVGLAQERMARAEEATDARLRVAEAALTDLTGVDGFDAAARVGALATTIEASLTVTARIERLSLVNYL